MKSKLSLLFIFLLAIGGSASAQLVLPICSAQANCPGFPVGSVQAPVDQNGWRNFKVTLTQNVTSFSFVGIPPSPAQAAVNIIFTEDAVGGRTVTFAAGISSPCTVTATANATTLCQFEYDGTAGVWIGISGGGGAASGGFSGTVTYTANQTASAADNGKLVKMNCAGACAYTLPNPQPSTTFYVELTTIGATIATIGLGSSMTVNASATAPLLTTNQVLSIWADTQTSTNYIQTGPSGMAPGLFNANYEPFFWGLGSSCSSYDNATHTATVSACLNGPASGDTAATNDGFASWVTVNDSSQDSTNADPRVPGYAYRGNCRTGVSNTICEGVFATAAESTTGLSNVKLIGNEIDTLVADAGITGIGVQIIPVGTAQPTANNYPAIQANVNVLHSGASLHTSGLNCSTGAIFIQSANAPCVVLGSQATGSSKNSQTLQFHATDSGGADHQLDITAAWSASAAMMNYSGNQQATITANSFMAIGVAQTAGNIALSGWGTGATVTAVSGFAQRFAFTITAGTTPAANPTVTATFSSPMPNAPICVAFPEGGTGTQANLFRAIESTSGSGAMVWQGGTPTNAATYLFVIDCRL